MTLDVLIRTEVSQQRGHSGIAKNTCPKVRRSSVCFYGQPGLEEKRRQVTALPAFTPIGGFERRKERLKSVASFQIFKNHYETFFVQPSVSSCLLKRDAFVFVINNCEDILVTYSLVWVTVTQSFKWRDHTFDGFFPLVFTEHESRSCSILNERTHITKMKNSSGSGISGSFPSICLRAQAEQLLYVSSQFFISWRYAENVWVCLSNRSNALVSISSE